MENRKIIHVDMDAFFASIEQRDHPELRGKPIAVGHDGPRGVVATASYEARRFGVHSAMPAVAAKRRCPNLIFVNGDHAHYKDVSNQVHAIFLEYTDLIEPISIDEAFLDVTKNKVNESSATQLATEIRNRIQNELHLTASAGVSFNKFLAKIASDYRKPNGQYVITPSEASGFLAQLPIEKFWGVGSHTKERMHKIGIFTGADLRRVSRNHLLEVFGKMGVVYYDFARGLDFRPVSNVRERKSVGCEETFEEDIVLPSQAIIRLYHLVLELVERIKRAKFRGRTFTLKVKYTDFKTISKSVTVNKYLETKEDILPLAKNQLKSVPFSASSPIRLLGVSVSHQEMEKQSEIRPRWVQGWLNFGEDTSRTRVKG